MEDMKECTECKTLLPLSEFSKHRITKDGLNHTCKKCNSERTRIFRNTASGVYTQLKGRFVFYGKKNMSITRDEFVDWYDSQKRVCVYCDIPESKLNLWTDNYHSHTLKLTVDCKNNAFGYIKNNLVLACERCNATKGNLLSFEEMRDMAQRYIRPKWEALDAPKTIEEES